MKRTPEQISASLARSAARAAKLEAQLAKRAAASRAARKRAGSTARTRQGTKAEKAAVHEVKVKEAAFRAARKGDDCDRAIDAWLATTQAGRMMRRYGRVPDERATRYVGMVLQAVLYGTGKPPEWRVIVLGVVQLALSRQEATINVADLKERIERSPKFRTPPVPTGKLPRKKETKRCMRTVVFGVRDLDVPEDGDEGEEEPEDE